jgi:hypothetical protein
MIWLALVGWLAAVALAAYVLSLHAQLDTTRAELKDQPFVAALVREAFPEGEGGAFLKSEGIQCRAFAGPEYAAKWLASHPDYHRERRKQHADDRGADYWREWRRKNPERVAEYKRRARDRRQAAVTK